MLGPDTFRVERRITVNAEPEKLFSLINDLRRWPEWSPWEKLDPAMKKTYNGPANGKGASSTWDGNKKAGAGRMEIVDARPNAKVTLKLDFFRPFKNHTTTEFILVPQGSATNVTWSMEGPVPLIGRILHLFFNMDKIVGADFEAGLANLRSIAER